jgi:hypothetical protein
MSTHLASYSPDDNKLRLYPESRLSAEVYARVKGAGFAWAAKQKLFVAPTWTPEREDLLIELCGQIDDDDTSLTERADDRADRFEGYQENRAKDATRAREYVESITAGIPLGQPILVGHHSERHARRDAARIESGMRRAVKAFETSEYWRRRAAGAVAHAKYKERPDVRARRIKTIEAAKRKAERSKAEAQSLAALWSRPGLTLEQGRAIAGTHYQTLCRPEEGHYGWTAYDLLRPEAERSPKCPAWSLEEVRAAAMRICDASIKRCDRWLVHYENRLTYERAMLEDQGAAELLAPKPRPKQLPLCNYRQPQGVTTPRMYQRGELEVLPMCELQARQYARIHSESRGTRIVDRSHRVRVAYIHQKLHYVYLIDKKTDARPEAAPAPAPSQDAPRPMPTMAAPREVTARTAFDEMRDTLRGGGIKVVSAPQLFPTPIAIAAEMVKAAGIQPGDRVLEPSAGTGRLLDAIAAAGGVPTAVELNVGLAQQLRQRYADVRQADFLECGAELGEATFAAAILNPPYSGSHDGKPVDVAHILHAMKFVRPGGRLVALCANGPRQERALGGLAETFGGEYTPLPDDTFASEGTGVRVAMLVIEIPE